MPSSLGWRSSIPCPSPLCSSSRIVSGGGCSPSLAFLPSPPLPPASSVSSSPLPSPPPASPTPLCSETSIGALWEAHRPSPSARIRRYRERRDARRWSASAPSPSGPAAFPACSPTCVALPTSREAYSHGRSKRVIEKGKRKPSSGMTSYDGSNR